MKNLICPFCAKLDSSGDQGTSPWDTILLQSKNFVVWPSIGAIVEGWLLVVPKQHYICMGALPDAQFAEMEDLASILLPLLVSRYGAVALFEHGPAAAKQPVGCGIDHAHLHIVPTQCDLMAGARRIFPEIIWIGVKAIKSTMEFHSLGRPYLYLEQPAGEAYLATHPDLPSQLFRKVIATDTGNPNRYDWRRFPEEQNVSSTISKLRPLVSMNSADPPSLSAL